MMRTSLVCQPPVQNAAMVVQGTILRCIAFGRVKKMRHRRRGQAQALIARVARQRAALVRQKELEEREQQEEHASAMAMMRVRHLTKRPSSVEQCVSSVPLSFIESTVSPPVASLLA